MTLVQYFDPSAHDDDMGDDHNDDDYDDDDDCHRSCLLSSHST